MMRTMFVMGFRSDPFWMGQETAPLSKEERDSLYGRIDQALDKFSVVEEWRKNHPDWERDLGPDLDAYNSFSADERKYGSVAQAVHDRLEGDPAGWTVAKEDRDAALTWVYAVGQLYLITSDHPKRGPLPKPAERVKPGPVPTAAPAAPSAGPAAPSGAPPPKSTVLGIPTTQALIGGGLAVGVGVLLYSVLS